MKIIKIIAVALLLAIALHFGLGLSLQKNDIAKSKDDLISQRQKSSLLKVSKSRKKNTKFSNTYILPKNQRNFVHFFALASRGGLIEKWTLSIVLNSPDLIIQIMKCFYFFFCLNHFKRLGQKNVWEDLVFWFRDWLTFTGIGWESG